MDRVVGRLLVGTLVVLTLAGQRCAAGDTTITLGKSETQKRVRACRLVAHLHIL